jgi:hypothetical protein
MVFWKKIKNFYGGLPTESEKAFFKVELGFLVDGVD